MGRSSKTIHLVLIGPALIGSSLTLSGCSPEFADEGVPDEGQVVVEGEDTYDGWFVAEGDEQGGYWGPPGEESRVAHQYQGTHHYHRSNIGGLIGGYLGARAAGAAARGGGGGMSSAPVGGGTSRVGGGSHVGGTSSRGGFGSSAGHASASS